MNQQTKEALKMAIEALENVFGKGKNAIIALKACKEALAQPAQEPKCSEHPDAPHGFCRDASHSADRYVCECELWEEPAQKPVAWTKQSELDKTTTLRCPIVMWKNQYASIENNVPLYIHPTPTKEWQGLSGDEIEKIDEVTLGDYYKKQDAVFFARAIEQALKEKNK